MPKRQACAKAREIVSWSFDFILGGGHRAQATDHGSQGAVFALQAGFGALFGGNVAQYRTVLHNGAAVIQNGGNIQTDGEGRAVAALHLQFDIVD